MLGFVVSKGGSPSFHVTGESGSILSSGSRDLISELGDKSDDLINSSTIASLGEHGQGVNQRQVGRILTKSLEFVSNLF